MNYLTFKLIVGDDPGAALFQKLAALSDSIKKLDGNYFGPEHYWRFFQLGDFDMVDITIVKWEVWSNWHLKGNVDNINKGAFIGVTCGLFFFQPGDAASYAQMKDTMNIYFEKRRSEMAPMIVIAVDEQGVKAVSEEQSDFIKANGGLLMGLTPKMFEEEDKLAVLINRWLRVFLKILNPDICATLGLEDNYWHLPIQELQAILMSDRQGVQIRPRHAPPLPKPEPKEEVKEVPEEKPDETEVAPEPEFEARKLTAADLSEEELKHVAIGPDGEIIPLEEGISSEEIVDLLERGFKLPPWVVIPRHCSKCYNQSQKSIHEVIDKTVVLMQNPMI